MSGPNGNPRADNLFVATDIEAEQGTISSSAYDLPSKASSNWSGNGLKNALVILSLLSLGRLDAWLSSLDASKAFSY
jgi:hypothetical protein